VADVVIYTGDEATQRQIGDRIKVSQKGGGIMIKKGLSLCILLSILSLGCVKMVPPPTLAEMDTANYGTSPGDGATLIKSYLHDTLVDPYSIRDLQITPPKKCWFQRNEYAKPDFGYCSFATFNSKNRMGGYVGIKTYFLFIQDGYVITFTEHYIPWQYGYAK
jgi:hypothetical protein